MTMVDAAVAATATTAEEEDHHHHPRVCLRLRRPRRRNDAEAAAERGEESAWVVAPAAAEDNKKNAVRLLGDGGETTVELDGVVWDPVLDEHASDTDDSAIADAVLYDTARLGDLISHQLVERGSDCSLVAYGATGTGKTSLLFGGAATGSHKSEKNSRSSSNNNNRGLLHRLTEDLFAALQHQKQRVATAPPESVTLRCSVVEVYLERVRDLLWPHHDSPGAVRLDSRSHQIVGAAALSCVSAADVLAIIQRGLAARTLSSNRDRMQHASRSSVVVQLHLEQHFRHSNTCTRRRSRLQVFDVLGSELVHAGSQNDTTLEAAQISLSLKALHQQILRHHSSPTTCNRRSSGFQKLPAVTRLLLDAILTQNTTLLLTVSPTNHADTARTLQFGADCRRLRLPVFPSTTTITSTTNDNLQQQQPQTNIQTRLQELVQALARECGRLQAEQPQQQQAPEQSQQHSSPSRSRTLWELIEQINRNNPQQQEEIKLDFFDRLLDHTDSDTTLAQQLEQTQHQSSLYQQQLEQTVSERDQLCSDLVLLQTQNAALETETARQRQQIATLQHELATAQQRHEQATHHWRVAQFREREAVTYFRQMRRFYYRLLKQTAAADRTTRSVVPGALNLSQLRDLDRFLLESGLLEESEAVGGDVSVEYSGSPSRAALERSRVAHQAAAAREPQSSSTDDVSVDQPSLQVPYPPIEASLYKIPPPVPHEASSLPLPTDDDDGTIANGKQEVDGLVIVDAKQATPPKSIVHPDREDPEQIEARQRLYQTPAGRFVAMREHVLEQELLQLSELNARLHQELDEAKTNVAALARSETNGGVAAAFDKMRVAQEPRHLKEQLERKNNDLKAVIWKMNELHMVGQNLKSQSQHREQHVGHLEEHLAAAREQNAISVVERQAVEQRLRSEIESLQEQIQKASTPIWHLDNNNNDGDDATKSNLPLSFRLVVPFTTKSNIDDTTDPAGNASIGEPGEWVDLLQLDSSDPAWARDRCDVGTQTDVGDTFIPPEGITEDNIDCLLFMDSSSSPLPLPKEESPSVADALMGSETLACTPVLNLKAPSSLLPKNTGAPSCPTRKPSSDLENFLFMGGTEEDKDVEKEHLYSPALQLDSTHATTTAFDGPLMRDRVGETGTTTSSSSKPVAVVADKWIALVDGGGGGLQEQPQTSTFGSVGAKSGMSEASRVIMARALSNDILEPSQLDIDAEESSTLENPLPSTKPLGRGPLPSEKEFATECDKELENAVVATTRQTKGSGTVSDEPPDEKNVNPEKHSATAATPTEEKDLDKEINAMKEVSLHSMKSQSQTLETLDGSSADRTVEESLHSGVNAVEEKGSSTTSSVVAKRGIGPVRSSFLERLQKQAQRKLETQSEVQEGGKPEFMKLFNKIGGKNQNEQVLETTGGAPIREATIISFEQLHLRKGEKGFKLGDENRFASASSKWTPRKKESDSDSDSKVYSRPLGGDDIYPGSQSSSAQTERRLTLDSDSESSDDNTFAKNFMSGTQTVAGNGSNGDQAVAGHQNGGENDGAAQTDRRLTLDSDSESSDDDSFAKNFMSGTQTVAGSSNGDQAVSGNQNGVENDGAAQKGSRLTLDSDPESSDDDSLAKSFMRGAQVTGNSNRGQNGDDDTQSSTPNATTVPKEDSTSVGLAYTGATPVEKNDSDDSDSDDESKSSPEPALSLGVAMSRLGNDEKDSDLDSSDSDEESRAPPKPALSNSSNYGRRTNKSSWLNITKDLDSELSDDESRTPAATAVASGAAASLPLSSKNDSESDNSVSSDDESKAPPEPTVSAAAQLPLSSAKNDSDSDSDSDSSDDDESKAPVTKPAVSLGASSLSRPNSKNNSGDSDSDSSDDDESKAPVTKPAVSLGASSLPRLNSKNDSEDSDSDSSDDDESKAPVIKPEVSLGASTLLRLESKNDSEDSDSDLSDDDESQALAAKPAVSLGAASLSRLESEKNDSDSSDDDESHAPATKPALSLSDDSDDDSSDEDESKAQATKPALSLADDSDSDSSDDESKAPAKPIAPYTGPGSSRLDKKDSDSDSDTSDDDESKAPAKPMAPFTGPGSSRLDIRDSDSDSESSDDESTATEKAEELSHLDRKHDSDSESEPSDDESKVLRKPDSAAPSRLSDSTNDSESDPSDSSSSSDDESKAISAPPQQKHGKNSGDDDDLCDDESQSEPAKNDSPKIEDSFKNEESSSVYEDVSSKATGVETKQESSSDEESSSDNESVVKKPSGKDSSSKEFTDKKDDSDEEASSDDDSTKPAEKSAKKSAASSSSHKGSEKPRFIMEHGKLVKIGGSQSQPKKPSSGTKKAKFVIKDGKLVKNEKSVNGSQRATSSRKGKAGGDEPKKAPSSKSKKTDFVIKDGKLVKKDAVGTSAMPKKKKPAFTIVDGKLVKASKSSKNPSRSGKKKAKK